MDEAENEHIASRESSLFEEPITSSQAPGSTALFHRENNLFDASSLMEDLSTPVSSGQMLRSHSTPSSLPVGNMPNEKDKLIFQLKLENDGLKLELENTKKQDQRIIESLERQLLEIAGKMNEQNLAETMTQSESHPANTHQVLRARSLLFGAVILIFAVLVSFLDRSYFFGMAITPTNAGFCNPHKYHACDNFLLQKFKNLAHKYNDQGSNTWATLYAAAHDHVSYRPTPNRPIVIMAYGLKNSSRVMEILEDVAGAYKLVLPPKGNYGNILIDGKSFTDSDPEETQKKIQKMFENGFEKEAKKVAIVHDFDKLPSCSVLTFHNYCNNDDAPHKEVAFILKITGRDEKLSSDPSAPELEKAVSKLLHEKWKDCPEDLPPGRIDEMLSSVANNVILLR